MSNDKYLNYETKCRRCGELEEYSLGTKNDWNDFSDYSRYIHEILLKRPQCNYCNNCDKNTVQDVVSFTSADKLELMKTKE